MPSMLTIMLTVSPLRSDVLYMHACSIVYTSATVSRLQNCTIYGLFVTLCLARTNVFARTQGLCLLQQQIGHNIR